MDPDGSKDTTPPEKAKAGLDDEKMVKIRKTLQSERSIACNLAPTYFYEKFHMFI